MKQYKKLGFIKKCFFTRLVFLSTLTSITLLSTAPLSCIFMNNRECKVRPQIVNVNNKEPVFFPLKQVNAVVVAIISMTRMQNCVFLML